MASIKKTIRCRWTVQGGCTVELNWTGFMPGYMKNAMIKHQHKQPKWATNAPRLWERPNYWAKQKFSKEGTQVLLLAEEKKKLIQKVFGKLLLYGRALNPTLPVALRTIAAEQTKGKMSTL